MIQGKIFQSIQVLGDVLEFTQMEGGDLVVLMIYISQKIKWQKRFLYLNLTVASQ